jgi:hypothetical protein
MPVGSAAAYMLSRSATLNIFHEAGRDYVRSLPLDHQQEEKAVLDQTIETTTFADTTKNAMVSQSACSPVTQAGSGIDCPLQTSIESKKLAPLS